MLQALMPITTEEEPEDLDEDAPSRVSPVCTEDTTETDSLYS